MSETTRVITKSPDQMSPEELRAELNRLEGERDSEIACSDIALVRQFLDDLNDGGRVSSPFTGEGSVY